MPRHPEDEDPGPLIGAVVITVVYGACLAYLLLVFPRQILHAITGH